MEKLQAALARAREKRGDDGSERDTGPQLSAKKQSHNRATAAAVDDAWSAIPKFEANPKRLRQLRVVAADATDEAQQFDILRTKLLLEMRRHGWKRIAITSPTSSCGKTTVGCNLIVGLGRQANVRGMLFDMDWRRPAIAKFFGAQPAAGLPEVLSGSVPFEEQALRLHDNTIVSLTPRAVSDPAKLLLRQQTADVLDAIQKRYSPDVMLFDLPPVLISDETRAFLKLVDAALIVAGAEGTTMAQLDECERETAEYTTVAGIVLNKCRFVDDGYGYNY